MSTIERTSPTEASVSTMPSERTDPRAVAVRGISTGAGGGVGPAGESESQAVQATAHRRIQDAIDRLIKPSQI
jgi:hypothetical protein